MPRLEATQIDLSNSEHQELEKLLRRTTTPQQIALRAKIILQAATGLSNVEIAQEIGVNTLDESEVAAEVAGIVSNRSASHPKT